jgi:thiamine-phosphate pyrophosphorylase
LRARLYLITPRTIDLSSFPAELAAALAAGDVGSLLIDAEVSSEAHLQRLAEALVPVAHAHDVAVMVRNDSRAMNRSRADGVHVDKGIEALKEAISAGKGKVIVGAANLRSRHEAMEAAESGADYVFFGLAERDDEEVHRKTIDLGAWWAEVFEAPCVLLAGRTATSIEDCARTGADFVAVREAVWLHPGGAAAGVQAANALLDLVAAETGASA